MPRFYNKVLIVEALFYLVLARVALACMPYRVIAWFLNRTVKQKELQDPQRKILRNAVRWSVLRAAQLLPGKTVCFPRGIAAQSMLRRRKVGTTLYYGAATFPGKGLRSHVWVMDGQDGVVGYRASRGYKIISRYPE